MFTCSFLSIARYEDFSLLLPDHTESLLYPKDMQTILSQRKSYLLLHLSVICDMGSKTLGPAPLFGITGSFNWNSHWNVETETLATLNREVWQIANIDMGLNVECYVWVCSDQHRSRAFSWLSRVLSIHPEKGADLSCPCWLGRIKPRVRGAYSLFTEESGKESCVIDWCWFGYTTRGKISPCGIFYTMKFSSFRQKMLYFLNLWY